MVITFQYEVATKSPVEDDAFLNEYLPNIQEFSQSSFKDDLVYCDLSSVKERSGLNYAVSVIDFFMC